MVCFVILTRNNKSATNVHGIIVPLSGHWISKEQPQFVVEQLAKFFSER